VHSARAGSGSWGSWGTKKGVFFPFHSFVACTASCTTARGENLNGGGGGLCKMSVNLVLLFFEQWCGLEIR
jgi:hypothetical protein